MRSSEVKRITGETNIQVKINLDGGDVCEVASGVPFFDHMLTLFAKHGLFDLTVKCTGDVEVDDHHSVEDIGIAMGQAFLKAMGDKRSIKRYSHIMLPMDEVLMLVSVDVSGRPFLAYDCEIKADKTGNFDTCLLEEFLRAFVMASGITLHVKLMYGSNAHHIIEAVFKALARTLDEATIIDARVKGVPSTKGVL